MEVALTTGASLRQPIAWHGINWAKVHRTVRRLQVRIVKAIQVNCCVLRRAFEWPEPTASKDARWVLWGRGLATVPRYPTESRFGSNHLDDWW